MIPESEASLSCPVLATPSTKKQVIQTSRTIVIPHMTRVRFCTGILFPGEIKTEIFSTLLTEFKKVLIQHRSTDLTVKDLHPHNHKSEIRISKSETHPKFQTQNLKHLCSFGSFVFWKFGLVSNFVLRISNFLSRPYGANFVI